MGQTDTCILVVGMHRSGTSAMTGLLSACGAFPGADLLGANTSNPKGYFESRRLVALNNAILQAAGSAWDASDALPEDWWSAPGLAPLKDEMAAFLMMPEFDGRQRMLKDPRLCRTMPLWRPVLDSLGIEARVVLCLREPVAVAQSQRLMKGFPYLKSLMLYVGYCLDAERHTRACRRAAVRYTELVDDWTTVLARLERELTLGLGTDVEAWRRRADGFIAPELNRYDGSDTEGFDACGELAQLAQQTFDALCRGDTGALDELGARFAAYQRQVRPWMDSLNQLTRLEDQLILSNPSPPLSRPRLSTSAQWAAHSLVEGAKDDGNAVKATWPDPRGRHRLTLALGQAGPGARLRIKLVDRPALVQVHACELRQGARLLHRWPDMQGAAVEPAKSLVRIGAGAAAQDGVAELVASWLVLDGHGYLDLLLPAALQAALAAPSELVIELVIELEALDKARAFRPLLSQLAKCSKDAEQMGRALDLVSAPGRSPVQALREHVAAAAAGQESVARLSEELRRAEAQLDLLKELLAPGAAGPGEGL